LKLRLFAIIFLLLLIPLVISKPIDFDKAYTWLYGQQPTDVTQAALTASSIAKIDPAKAQLFIDYLKNNKNPSQPCWPKSTCDSSSTAFVLLALNNGINIEGVSIEEVKNWLELAQQNAPLPGTWNLQIITSGIGTCDLAYAKRGSLNENPRIALSVDKGKISSPSCSQGQTFLDIRSCISQDIFSKPSTRIRINCPTLSDAKISVIYIENNAYYLVSESVSTTTDIIINNGYYTNLDSTYYSNWALKRSLSDVDSLLYLKKSSNINSVKDNSLLFLITNNLYYQSRLTSLKSQIGGYYGQVPNLWDNALAALALGQADTDLQEWFGSQQNANGYWQDTKTTALILFALGGTANLPECVAGQQKSCGPGVCALATQTCTSQNTWPGCTQTDLARSGYSATEICGNDKDDNCDGSEDEGCDCDPALFTTESCGLDIGICELGTRTCDPITKKWSFCQGETRPSVESPRDGNSCYDNRDNDCDGVIDCNDPDCQIGNDWDRDSILNDNDQEKCTPRSCLSDVIREGRPEFLGKAKDQDSDGICDSLDQCDNTQTGCPIYGIDQQKPGCPSDCSIQSCREGSDTFCRFTSCENDCGSGVFNTCDYQECSSISSSLSGCIFIPSSVPWLYNSCISCSSGSSCSSYQDERDCSLDPCSKGLCQWANNVCTEIPKSNFYKDNDNDGFGNTRDTTRAVTPPQGYVADNTDCDDSSSSIHPNAQEICDNKDNDCDPSTPTDINCACTPQTTQKCPLPQSNSLCTQTCTDQGQWSSCDTSRAGQESNQASCSNSQDDDCDGLIDCNDPDCGFDASQGTGDCDNDRTCDLFETNHDLDNDNIRDDLDQEKCTPRDCISKINPAGVKLDSDSDGICDAKDNCITAPGCSPVDPNGCVLDCQSNSACLQDSLCTCPSCDYCGGALRTLGCDYQECSQCAGGNCKYDGWGSSTQWGSCSACTSVDTCSSYKNQEDCSSDPCSTPTNTIGPCEWSGTSCVEKPKTNFYQDRDEDGFGQQQGIPLRAVTPPDGYVVNNQDCKDDNANVKPGAVEICNGGIDDDCDSSTREQGCSCSVDSTPTSCEKQAGVCSGAMKTCIDGSWSICDYSSDYLEVENIQESCSDNLDNDCDGYIDCKDPDCTSFDFDKDRICDSRDTDKDGDGIPNTSDKEEFTYYSSSENRGCSVWRSNDQVRNDLIGVAKDTTDSDGICDTFDKCQNTILSCQVQSYVDSFPGCPSDCGSCSLDPSCACDDCGSGFSLCTNEACLSLGEAGSGCSFKPGGIFSYSYCYQCNQITSCSSYLTQLDCETNQCLDSENTRCAWDTTTNLCKFKPKTNYYLDSDKDGFGSITSLQQSYTQPEGYIIQGGDCNDNDVNIKPEATELCDNLDNNCKEGIDEGCSCVTGRTQSCSQGKVGICTQAQSQVCGQDGKWPGCNYALIQTYQSEETLCDGLDNDCDSSIDEGCSCVAGTQRNCANQQGVCRSLRETCEAGTWPGCDYSSIQTYQSEETLCDGLDNDCDSSIDEGCSCTDGKQKDCANQQGICLGSIEICTNGAWPGCTKINYGTNYIETEATQALCSDNLDNDCDALADCLDPSCPGGGDFDRDNTCDLKDSDKDGDGIPNTNDKEEFTPLGCKINIYDSANLGKQLDTDSDKVCDGLDKCERTILSCAVQGLNDAAPGCPADCEVTTCVADPACECKTCAECISGTLDFCSQEECSVCDQGSCFYHPQTLAKNTCDSCATAVSCNTYLTQLDCSRNPCQNKLLGLNCTWSSNTCCIDNDKNNVCDDLECEPDWECDPWSICTGSEGTQTRDCEDNNDCDAECPEDDEDCIAERACSDCTPQWQCADWSECSNGIQPRDCRDINDCAHTCPIEDTLCLEQRSCGTCTPDWECTSWSECEDGIKTRECEDNNACNITCSINEAECIEERLCTTDEEPESSCGNGKCEQESDENQATCPSDCTPPNPCVVNSICEPQFGEDQTNCPDDCEEETTLPPPGQPYCGDSICDPNEDSTLCPDDCEEGTTPGPTPTPTPEQKSKLWIYIIIVILLILLIFAYLLFFKKKGSNKQNKRKPFSQLGSLLPEAPQRKSLFGPQQKPQAQRPYVKRERPKKSLVEDELERSIKEAEKLLHK